VPSRNRPCPTASSSRSLLSELLNAAVKADAAAAAAGGECGEEGREDSSNYGSEDDDTLTDEGEEEEEGEGLAYINVHHSQPLDIPRGWVWGRGARGRRAGKAPAKAAGRGHAA